MPGPSLAFGIGMSGPSLVFRWALAGLQWDRSPRRRMGKRIKGRQDRPWFSGRTWQSRNGTVVHDEGWINRSKDAGTVPVWLTRSERRFFPRAENDHPRPRNAFLHLCDETVRIRFEDRERSEVHRDDRPRLQQGGRLRRLPVIHREDRPDRQERHVDGGELSDEFHAGEDGRD